MVSSIFSLVSILIVAFIPVVAGMARFSKKSSKRQWISFAGGVALAYIMVHILPELAGHQAVLTHSEKLRRTLLTDFYVYLTALIGFVVFFGIERMILFHGKRIKKSKKQTSPFWIQVGSLAAHNILIGYLFRYFEIGFGALALSTFAFALHFFALDHHLRRQHPYLYHRFGRWLLALGVVLGWCLGYFIAVTGETEALLFAFMAGTVIVNSIKDEIPTESGGRFWPFCFGCILFTVLQLASFTFALKS